MRGSTILIAEDSDDVREFLEAGLSAAGHTVRLASDGVDVLLHLAQPAPDLILLDLHMPVLDGLQVLRRLRAAALWPQVPVLFLTASGATDDMVEARRLGARGYLTKPIRLSALVERVGRVLSQRDLLWIDDVTEVRSGPTPPR